MTNGLAPLLMKCRSGAILMNFSYRDATAEKADFSGDELRARDVRRRRGLFLTTPDRRKLATVELPRGNRSPNVTGYQTIYATSERFYGLPLAGLQLKPSRPDALEKSRFAGVFDDL